MPENALKILFAINPASGGKKKLDWETGIREYFKDSHHSFETFILDGDNDKTSLNYWINQWQPDRVVAVGGDGTVKLLAEQLLYTNVALGILPGGSANGMAKELQIPQDINEAIEIVVNGEIKDVDVISFGKDDICLHLSDFGLNADLVKYSEFKNWKGKLGYARGIFLMLMNKKRMKATFTSAQKVTKRDAYMIVLANAKTYGTGAIINPYGNLTDGLFEIVIVKEISFRELIKMFLNEKNFNPKKIEIFKVKEVTIELNRKINFQVDGEYRGKLKSVTATILPRKLKVIVPNSDIV